MTPPTIHPQAHSKIFSMLAMKSMKAGTITISKEMMSSSTDTTDSTLMELEVLAILEKLFSQGSKSLTIMTLLMQNATLKLNSMVL